MRNNCACNKNFPHENNETMKKRDSVNTGPDNREMDYYDATSLKWFKKLELESILKSTKSYCQQLSTNKDTSTLHTQSIPPCYFTRSKLLLNQPVNHTTDTSISEASLNSGHHINALEEMIRKESFFLSTPPNFSYITNLEENIPLESNKAPSDDFNSRNPRVRVPTSVSYQNRASVDSTCAAPPGPRGRKKRLQSPPVYHENVAKSTPVTATRRHNKGLCGHTEVLQKNSSHDNTLLNSRISSLTTGTNRKSRMDRGWSKTHLLTDVWTQYRPTQDSQVAEERIPPRTYILKKSHNDQLCPHGVTIKTSPSQETNKSSGDRQFNRKIRKCKEHVPSVDQKIDVFLSYSEYSCASESESDFQESFSIDSFQMFRN